jgi:hypothetical protein
MITQSPGRNASTSFCQRPSVMKTARASSVCGVIHDHRRIFEELREQLSPAVLGIWRLGGLVGHRRISGEMNTWCTPDLRRRERQGERLSRQE